MTRFATRRSLLPAVLLAIAAGCEAARPSEEPGQAAPAAESPAASASAGPPAGRYVCRQHTTTMGYLTIGPGASYEVSGVRGSFRMDPGSGDIEWQGGSYDEWNWAGRYEQVTRGAEDGRPDEDVIRLSSEADGLRIDCFLMRE